MLLFLLSWDRLLKELDCSIGSKAAILQGLYRVGVWAVTKIISDAAKVREAPRAPPVGIRADSPDSHPACVIHGNVSTGEATNGGVWTDDRFMEQNLFLHTEAAAAALDLSDACHRSAKLPPKETVDPDVTSPVTGSNPER